MTIQEVFDLTTSKDPFYFTRDLLTKEQIETCSKCKLSCKDTQWIECPIM